MSDNYSDTTNNHFKAPQNQITGQEPFEFDSRGIWGNPNNDDQLVIYLVIDLESEIISDCRWQLFGFDEAKAGISVLSELIKGLTLPRAFKLSVYQLIKKMDGFPDEKIQTIMTIIKTLQLAINSFYEENGMADKISGNFALKICKCMDVTDQQIETAIKNGATTFEQLQAETKVSTGCGTCAEKVCALLAAYQPN